MKKILKYALLIVLPIVIVILIFLLTNLSADKPIILITIDTIRDDYISCYPPYKDNTPHIKEFCKDSIIFQNAYTPVPQTLPSHVSIFTSLYPNRHGVYSNSVFKLKADVMTITKLLKSNGYETGAVVAAYILHSRYGLSEGFDKYIDEMPSDNIMPSQNAQITADEVTKRTIKLIDNFKQKKFFIWIHYFDPHTPYSPPLKYRQKYPNAYAGEVAFVDDEIGNLFFYLKKNNLYDNSLIILTGDHGESLGEHGENGHGYFLYNTTLRIPFMIKFPHSKFKGKIIPQEVITLDIFPTLCSFLNYNCSSSHLEGKNLLNLISNDKSGNPLIHQSIFAGTKVPEIDFGWAPLAAIMKKGWKYIESPLPELYNYENDPKEENNLYNTNHQLKNKLSKELTIWLAKEKEKEIDSKIKADPESMEKLQALGYIGGRFHTPKQQHTDVKSMKITISVLDQSTALLNQGKHTEAIAMVENEIERLEKENIPAPFLYSIAAYYHSKNKNIDKAIYYYNKHIELVPDFADTYIALAQIYKDEKKDYQKAIDYLKIAINLDPDIYEPYYMLGNLLVDLQNYDQAKGIFQKAVNKFPDNYDLLNAYARLLDFTQQYDDAIITLTKAIQLEPYKVDAYINLSIVYYDKGEIQKSYDNIQKALEVYPNHPLASQIKNTLIEPSLNKK